MSPSPTPDLATEACGTLRIGSEEGVAVGDDWRANVRVELEAAVVAAIAAGTGEPVDDSVLDATLDGLGIDSLTLVDVLFALEDQLGYELGEGGLQAVVDGGTIRELVDAYAMTAPDAVEHAPGRVD
jgi:acyl carrier protein